MNYGLPQVLMIILFTISFVATLYNDGKKQKVSWKAGVVGLIIQVAILKWGGFF